jgi:hypothetical protein
MYIFKKVVVKVIAIFVTSLLACAAMAQDQNQVCMVNNKDVDPVHTKYWQFALQNSDQAAMQQVAGTWYIENVSQELGAVQQMQQTYDANGLFSYQDETCVNGSCSQNQGHGMWVAKTETDGSIYVMINVSDLNRTNECTGFAATIQGNQMFAPGSNVVTATRVQ